MIFPHFMVSDEWITPRFAAQDVARQCGISTEQAVESLSMRLSAGYLVSMVKRVAGAQVPGSSILPSFDPQRIPANLWEADELCCAASSVWWTGDVRLQTSVGLVLFMGIRLTPLASEQTIVDMGFQPDMNNTGATFPSLLPQQPIISPDDAVYKRGYAASDAIHAAEIIRRKASGEFKSMADGAKRLFLEKESAGAAIPGNSPGSTIKRLERAVAKKLVTGARDGKRTRRIQDSVAGGKGRVGRD